MVTRVPISCRHQPVVFSHDNGNLVCFGATREPHLVHHEPRRYEQAIQMLCAYAGVEGEIPPSVLNQDTSSSSGRIRKQKLQLTKSCLMIT